MVSVYRSGVVSVRGSSMVFPVFRSWREVIVAVSCGENGRPEREL